MNRSRSRASRTRRWTLAHFRRPVFGWVQLLALLFLLLEPLSVSRGVYVPDSAGNPYWLPLSPTDFETGGPDMSDDERAAGLAQ